jgi:hypothetical protein
MPHEVPDRYEPLPGLVELPGYLGRRLPFPVKATAGIVAVAAAVAIVVVAPIVGQAKEDRARAEAEQRARNQALYIKQLRHEQRPRFGRGAPAGTELPARRRLLIETAAGIKVDANRRAAAGELHGPILRVECRGFPLDAASIAPETNPANRVGRYACIAVTSDIPATPGNRPGVVGHPYRARINFHSGRYAFCRVRGRPGELAVRIRPAVPVPAVCGG